MTGGLSDHGGSSEVMNKLQFTDDAELNMGVNIDGNAVDLEARARR